jgi:hypothetical protein
VANAAGGKGQSAEVDRAIAIVMRKSGGHDEVRAGYFRWVAVGGGHGDDDSGPCGVWRTEA